VARLGGYLGRTGDGEPGAEVWVLACVGSPIASGVGASRQRDPNLLTDDPDSYKEQRGRAHSGSSAGGSSRNGPDASAASGAQKRFVITDYGAVGTACALHGSSAVCD